MDWKVQNKTQINCGLKHFGVEWQDIKGTIHVSEFLLKVST